jgi:hypothetical protein
VKLNKNSAGDTASFLFQTGFSGRAEIGTTGDDLFHLKVSSNGSVWKDMLQLDAAQDRIDWQASQMRMSVSSTLVWTVQAGSVCAHVPCNWRATALQRFPLPQQQRR